MDSIEQQLKLIPSAPGSYRFYDKNGEIIYVGKAKNLKKRVSSYFHKNHDSVKLNVMVPQIVKIEFIITSTEAEALILESHLIKKYKPKYNVLLKDDKKYPYFLITEGEYPSILIVRKANKNPMKGTYFGPYTNAGAMHSTLELIKRLFPLKQCKNPRFKDRPCIYYQLGKCSAPCQKLISPEEYQKLIDGVKLFLSGKYGLLTEELKKQMLKYSENCEFEKAAKYRDAYIDVKKTTESAVAVCENTLINRDVIALAKTEALCAITLLQVRGGYLTNRMNFEPVISELDNDKEIIKAFLAEYYTMTNDIPEEILLNHEFTDEEKEPYIRWLTGTRKKKIKFTTKITEKTKNIYEIAVKNAKDMLERNKIMHLKEINANFNEVGIYIKEKLGLKNFPHRAECYDISHIQGSNTVASMVVFRDGKPEKSSYRKFKIRQTEGKPDDFLSMKEVLTRRFSKTKDPFPDLIIIDGGKGQLSSACEVLKEQNLDLDIVSLAKREEEIFIPHQKEPVIFPKNTEELFFFQQIRDEAHRFAITYHRKLRQKSTLESRLDEIKGLSEKSRKILIKNFADLSKLEKQPLEDLSLILPGAQARKVYKFFNG